MNARIKIIFISSIGFFSTDAAVLRWAKRFAYTGCTGLAGYVTYQHRFSHLLHTEWTVDKRPITTSWPRETVKWLRTHEVPTNLKQELDTIFLDKDTMKLLSKVYNEKDIQCQFFNKQFVGQNGFLDVEKMVTCKKAWDNDMKEAYAALRARGFKFFSTLDGKGFVFSNQQLPEYVFKMAPQEIYNIIRIVTALKLTKRVEKRGSNSIKIPRKYVYFLDPSLSGINYENIPKALVVAEAMYPKDSPTEQEKEQREQDIKLLEQIGFTDSHPENVYSTEKGTAVVDTESVKFKGRHVIPGLPFAERTGFVHLPCIHDSMRPLAMRYGLPPTQLHERTMFLGDKGLIAYRLKPEIVQKLKNIRDFLTNTAHGSKEAQKSGSSK